MKTLVVLMVTGGIAVSAWGVTPTPEEMAQARAWAQAKFEGAQAEGAVKAGLSVIENNDPLQLNERNGKPLHMDKQYARGLYAHAPSKVVVQLPGPGKTFFATVGVDSNEQTSGQRGSVVFAVRVGDAEKFRSGVMREGTAPLPLEVDLGGAQELTLIVEDSGDGISCDQSDWADARVALADGREVWLDELPILNEQRPFDTTPPFSFVYGGKASPELLTGWTLKRERKQLDDTRVGHTTVYTDPETKLEVRCEGIEYLDFPTVEWTVHFKNKGTADSPLLTDVKGLNARLDRGEQGEFVLHHQVGTLVKANDYEPLETVLEKGKTFDLAPRGGRPCGTVFPYFNLEYSGGGAIVVVGWSGQWSARFARDDTRGLTVTSGQETTHFVLRPGEEVRTPMTVMQFWRGDRTRAQNVWRRWMMAHNVPKPGGVFPAPQLTPCSSHQYGEMIHADEASQLMFIDRYLEERIPIAYWWMDAGWYVNETGWPNTGTWEVDTKRFPRGLRSITDYAHGKGLKSIVWFEPERVTPGTWQYVNQPEWLNGKGDGQKLLNLGNRVAWDWLVGHISGFIES
ncbi:MAG: NPCBM/NEW2 domain-containing protein, partial [FCB group bacterium]|nr:NPCBM/NEW2 domain-containing protein [FCB group bacterium]